MISIVLAGIDDDYLSLLLQSSDSIRAKNFFEPCLHNPELLEELHDFDLSPELCLTFFEQSFVSLWFKEAA